MCTPAKARLRRASFLFDHVERNIVKDGFAIIAKSRDIGMFIFDDIELLMVFSFDHGTHMYSDFIRIVNYLDSPFPDPFFRDHSMFYCTDMEDLQSAF